MTSTDLLSISDITTFRAEAERLWREGNDAGDGYGVGDDDDDVNAIGGLGRLVLRATTNTEVAVYETDGGVVLVGDCNGPWAIKVA